MKQGIHPQWHNDATISCACGTSITVGLAKDAMSLDICAACHPFFTGEMKFVDTMGRVEKFQKKQAAAAEKATEMAKKREKKRKRQEQLRNPKSLKEMLMGAR